MKKISIPSAGGYDKLQIINDVIPSLAIDDKLNVVIQIKASGINYADVIIRWGLYESAKKFVGWPITPGFEFAGIILEKGSDVTQFQIGEEVFGVSRFGAYASHIIVPSNYIFSMKCFGPRISEWTLIHAAAFPAVYMTAYYAMFELANVKENQTLLIHSAAGGVGTALLQMAKIINCRVIAVVGQTHKIEIVKELGADLIIDKSKDNLWQLVEKYAPEGCDIVF